MYCFFILVNNVGTNLAFPQYITESKDEDLWNVLNVNCGAVTMMSKMLLPQMRARQQGAIVNVSSGSELQPLPLMTVYAATKVRIIILLLFLGLT